MQTRWLVTPYFFEQFDSALDTAVPDGVAFRSNDPGDVADRSPGSLRRLHLPIARFVERNVRRGDLPLSIAGDCVASLPVMAGLQAAGQAPVLVWLDGHGDFNTPETSPSGFLGGMPLAMMVGRGEPHLGSAVGLDPLVEADVWLVGARDLDALEQDALERSSVHRASVAGFGDLRLDRPVHLHIDNDVIDAADVPANNYPVAGGPSLAETIDACVRFVSQNHVVAVSLSGWNGALDRDGQTATACRTLIGEIERVLLLRNEASDR